jgi:hypothetical protein
VFRYTSQRLIFSFLCLLLTTIFAGCPQGPCNLSTVGWVYNLSGKQWGHRIIAQSDGSLVVLAANDVGSADEGVAYLRLSAQGAVESSTIIPSLVTPPAKGGAGPSLVAKVVSDGDIIICGTTSLTITVGTKTEERRLRVTRIGQDGSSSWDNTYGDEILKPRVVVETSTGEILVAGNKSDDFNSNLDVFFLKLAANGETLAFHIVELVADATNLTVFRDGVATAEDAFYFVGDGSPVNLVKMNPELQIEEWYRLSSDVGGSPAGLELNSDGFTIIARSATGPERPALLSIDLQGNVVSTRDDIFTPSNSDESGRAYDFIVDSSGDIVMVGEGTTVRYIGNFFPQITIRPFIAKLTPDGDRIWERTINARGVIVNGVTETADGGYATTGAAPGPNGDVLLNVIRFDRNGNITN